MRNILISIVLLMFLVAYGQQGDGGSLNGYNYFLKTDKDIPTFHFDQPNISALRKEDKVNDSLKTGPWRFGFNYSTSIDFENAAAWYTNSSGDKVGILKITSPKAKTINLTFSNSQIPEGNELFIYNPEQTFVLGKFTQKHIYKGELGTELVPGSTVFVEYLIPKKNENTLGKIEISKVTHGYRTAQEYQTKVFGSSGNCNMNVNCPDGAPYVNQRNSALMLVAGSNGFCSGALINNTEFDGTPYVLTANHCYNSNVTNWVFRFNWQSPDCNNPTSSPSFESLSGSTLHSRRIPSDFMLLEITGGLVNGTVPQTHNPFFAGWDNGDAAPSSTFGIHHPNGDIKKISFDDDPAMATQAMQSTEVKSSWRVEWDRNTTTEGGSSGSPLFNQDGLIIGQLWGGNAGCNGSTSSGQDYYGRIHNSWEPIGSTNAEQLKYWLDPSDTDNQTVIGYDPYSTPLDRDVALTKIIDQKNHLCEPMRIPKIQVINKGVNPIHSMVIEYTYNNGATELFNWSGNISMYAVDTLSLPVMNQANGLNTMAVSILIINGFPDQDLSDNSLSIDYVAAPNGVNLDFEFFMGCYADEVSWELRDDNNMVLYEGSGYPSSNFNYLVEKVFCLTSGCYQLILMDSYGDGVEGAAYSQCDYTGSMTLIRRDNNELLAYLTEEEANFGTEIAYNFCLDDLSLTTQELDRNISIYPNPSKGSFKIEMEFEGSKEIILKSMAGKVVSDYQTDKGALEISEHNLPAGIYMVTISTNKNSVTRKIIIE